MSDGVSLFLALLSAVGGMSCLALSMGTHWRQLLGDRPQANGTVRGLRAAGALLLGVSFLWCTLADPVSMAALVWPMLLTVAAAIVAAGFTLRGQMVRRRSISDINSSRR